MIRFLPVPLYDTRRCQLFFEKMHKEGKHLTQVWGPFAFFKKGEQEDVKYAVVPMADHRLHRRWFAFGYEAQYLGPLPGKARREEIKSLGWDYVDRYLNVFIHRGKSENIAGQFPADSEDIRRTRNLPLNSETSRIMFGGFVQMSFMTAVTLLGSGVAFSIMQGDSVPFILIWLRILIGIIRTFLYRATIIDEMQLRDDEIVSWKEKSTKRRIWNWIYRIAFLMVFLNVITGFEKLGEFSLQSASHEMPAEILRLEDIEGIQEDESIIYDPEQSTYYNTVEFIRSHMTTMEYELREKYIIEGRHNEDGDAYKPELSIDYYNLANERIAKYIVRDMARRHMRLPIDNIEQIQSEVFDAVYVEKTSYATYLVIGWEDKAMYIRYRGEQTVETIVQAAEEVYGH